jgi:hypothetical protein
MPWIDEVSLGPKQSFTSEGFLLARDVPLARIGVQHYYPSELQMDGIGSGTDLIEVERLPEDVFDPQSIRTFQGRPIVDEHPLDMLDPDNVHMHQIGTVLNVRRGEPPDDDVLLGDMLFTSRRGIDLVRGGKRAVSVGYDASYINTGPNRARQTAIRANHIALVDEGRCGPRCMIGDAAPKTKRQRAREQAERNEYAHMQDSGTRGHDMRQRTRDQTARAELSEWSGNRNFVENMGRDPGGRVGPELMAVFEGNTSQFSLLNLGPGRVGVMKHSDINGRLDAGTIAAGTTNLPAAQRRMSSDAIRQRNADEAWCRGTLQNINRANAAFWAQNQGKR